MKTTDPVSLLSESEFFSALSAAELERLAEQGEIQTFEFGDSVFKAGDTGKGVYMVVAGSVRIFSEEQGKEVSIGVLEPGDVAAEIAALRKVRLDVSARASSRAQLLFLPGSAIAALLARNKKARAFMAHYATVNAAGGFITQLFQLRGKLDRDELRELTSNIGIKKARQGQTILAQGANDDHRLYVIRQGTVGVTYEHGGETIQLSSLGQDELLGEKSCLTRQSQPFEVRATTDVALLVIPQESVSMILERNPQVRTLLENRVQQADRELERQKRLAERHRKPVLLDLRSKQKLGERVINRFPLVEQAEQADCGAACLTMICRHYGIRITLGKLREMANVTTEGATLESLAKVGESLGFTTRGLQCTYQSMLGFDLPFIAHWEGYHYIIVYGVSKEHAWVADPALGFRKLERAEFEKGWTGTCLLFSPDSDMQQIDVARSPWVRFVRFMRPHKKTLGYLLLATLVIEVLGLAPPIIVQNILDRVVVHQNVQLLHLLIVGFVLAQLFMQFSTLMRTLLSNFMVRNLDLQMMSQFFRHAMSLPVSFFVKRRTGDIFARFQENQTIRSFLTESTISTVLNLLMLVLYFFVLFLYSPQMTGLLIVMVIPMIVLTLVITPKIKSYARREFDASTDAEAVLMEMLGGAETIKAMGIERPMRMQWEKKYAKALNVQYDAERFSALVGLVGQLLRAAITIVMLWVGATLVLKQQLSIGQLMAFNMLMGSVMAPIMGLIGLWDELHEAGVAMERLGDVLDLEPEQKSEDLPSRIMLPDFRGDVRFENVYFRYGGSESPYVLENISFELKAGQTVAVVVAQRLWKDNARQATSGFLRPNRGQDQRRWIRPQSRR